jgi:small nuclear ribonucleoprotein (snRNP)-like protein
MEPMGDAWVKKFKTVKVKLKDGTIINGKLNIGEYARVFDYFRSSPDQYFILSDAEHDEQSGKVVIINKNEIVWAEPEDT